MNLRQKTSRYCAAVMFFAGIAGAFLLIAVIRAGFRPEFEIWLASALVISLILHARAGFALSWAQQEIELLRRQSQMIVTERRSIKSAPSTSLQSAQNVSGRDSKALERVRNAIEHDRIDLYLQPIVSLPQRRQRFFEAFSRLRNEDGSVLRPGGYLHAAERTNRVGIIDNLILLRAVQAMRNLCANNQNYRIFCNISPATIFDEDFFARFSDTLDADADLSAKFVFEFTNPAVEMMHERVERNLQAIARRGFVFSIDHVRRFDLDWRALREKNFRYAKTTAAMLVGAYRGDAALRERVETFMKQLRDNDIDLIVEKVESEAQMPDIIELGIDYGQGDLFASPRPAESFTAESPAWAKAS
jgi:cyclic-di-GMP phosphodiesterase TipF (flagellum assembly factor)